MERWGEGGGGWGVVLMLVDGRRVNALDAWSRREVDGLSVALETTLLSF